MINYAKLSSEAKTHLNELLEEEEIEQTIESLENAEEKLMKAEYHYNDLKGCYDAAYEVRNLRQILVKIKETMDYGGE